MSKATLNELMGTAGDRAESRELSLDDLKDILGERMPKLEFSPVGKMRLQSALRKRFGDDYMHIPGVSEIMKDFDKETQFNILKQKMRLIKAKGGK